MTHDIENYLRDVGSRLRLPAREREQVLRELRAHVEDKVADLRAGGRDEAAAVALALADLGAPHELAIAYNGTRTEVRNRRGETVLRVGRAVGRGTLAFLKWAAVAAALLVLAGGVAVYVVYQEAKPYIEDTYPRPVFGEHRDCAESPCTGLPRDSSFGVPPGARSILADVEVDIPVAGGSVRVTVADPSGKVVYERTFAGGASRVSETDTLTWGPDEGTWKVTLQYAGFTGRFDMDVLAIGLPPGTLR